MKKLLFVAAIALVSMASCKKDYTCTCTDNGGYSYVLTSSKKKAADAVCTGAGIGGVTIAGVAQPKTASTCTLK